MWTSSRACLNAKWHLDIIDQSCVFILFSIDFLRSAIEIDSIRFNGVDGNDTHFLFLHTRSSCGPAVMDYNNNNNNYRHLVCAA